MATSDADGSEDTAGDNVTTEALFGASVAEHATAVGEAAGGADVAVIDVDHHMDPDFEALAEPDSADEDFEAEEISKAQLDKDAHCEPMIVWP